MASLPMAQQRRLARYVALHAVIVGIAWFPVLLGLGILAGVNPEFENLLRETASWLPACLSMALLKASPSVLTGGALLVVMSRVDSAAVAVVPGLVGAAHIAAGTRLARPGTRRREPMAHSGASP